MLVKVENGVPVKWPVPESAVPFEFPNRSFTNPIDPQVLAELGYFEFRYSDPPQFNPVAKKAVEADPVADADGVFVQHWEILSLFTEYADDAGVVVTEEDQEAAAIAAAELAQHEASAAADLAARKAARQQAVDSITVEVDGMVFDGDEKSQDRMNRGITVLTATGGTGPWVLHDNTVAQVTAAQLTQALALAGAEQARLWVMPYEQAP